MRFYDPTGEPPDQIESKILFPKASEESGARRCLALGLVPSVTNVLNVIREEYLERWKIRQGIENFERHGNKWSALDAIYNKDSKESTFGTEVHDAVHRFVTGKPIEKNRQWEHALPAVAWIKSQMEFLEFSELRLACKETGAGGTADLGFTNKKGELILADIKVVKFRRDYPPKPSLSYKAQLSAYEMMLRIKGFRPMRRISVYLASPFGDLPNPRRKIFEHERDYSEEFRSALKLWHGQFGEQSAEPQVLEE